MFLCEATHAVIARAVECPVPGNRKKLWAVITSQIAKKDTFDGHFADVVLEIIRTFLKAQDDKTIFKLYRDTDAGMRDDAEGYDFLVGSARINLEMELLKAVTDAAWDEASPRKKGRKSQERWDDPDHDPYDPW